MTGASQPSGSPSHIRPPSNTIASAPCLPMLLRLGLPKHDVSQSSLEVEAVNLDATGASQANSEQC